MGKLGNQPLRGENKRPSPTAHRTAIFSHSQGAGIAGTKPSVLDRLPCWGRRLGAAGGSGEGKQREAEARLWLRPPHGPQREGRWPMGNWAVCGGAAGASAQDRPEP